MNRIVALGAPELLGGYRLVGATVLEAADDAAVDRAWAALPADTAVLVLTPAAARRLAGRLPERVRLTWAVLPR